MTLSWEGELYITLSMASQCEDSTLNIGRMQMLLFGIPSHLSLCVFTFCCILMIIDKITWSRCRDGVDASASQL